MWKIYRREPRRTHFVSSPAAGNRGGPTFSSASSGGELRVTDFSFAAPNVRFEFSVFSLPYVARTLGVGPRRGELWGIAGNRVEPGATAGNIFSRKPSRREPQGTEPFVLRVRVLVTRFFVSSSLQAARVAQQLLGLVRPSLGRIRPLGLVSANCGLRSADCGLGLIMLGPGSIKFVLRASSVGPVFRAGFDEILAGLG